MMKTDELRELVGDYPNDDISLLERDLAREVIALREAAGELANAVERAKLHQYPATQEALATLRAVLGEGE
jgi:hypothetical protein